MGKFKYLIRKRALGDVLWIEPVVRAIAAQNKGLIVYTKYPELFENFPLPSVIFRRELPLLAKLLIAFEKKAGKQWLTINLDDAYEKRPDIHFLHAYQVEARLPLTEEYPRLYLSDLEKKRWQKTKFVVLHLESFSDKKFRQVFGVDWNEIVHWWNSKGYEVLQVGKSPQQVTGTKLVSTSIREMIALIASASYFIGIDSGPSHIAASLHIPSLIFFGAVNPENRHFPKLFKGILFKKPCEYDNRQDLVINQPCLACTRTKDPGIAACSLYSTDAVLSSLIELTNRYDPQIPA